MGGRLGKDTGFTFVSDKVNVKPLFDTKGIRRNKHRSIHTEK